MLRDKTLRHTYLENNSTRQHYFEKGQICIKCVISQDEKRTRNLRKCHCFCFTTSFLTTNTNTCASVSLITRRNRDKIYRCPSKVIQGPSNIQSWQKFKHKFFNKLFRAFEYYNNIYSSSSMSLNTNQIFRNRNIHCTLQNIIHGSSIIFWVCRKHHNTHFTVLQCYSNVNHYSSMLFKY